MVKIVKRETKPNSKERNELITSVREAYSGVIPTVSPVQIRRAMRRAGVWAKINSAVKDLEEEDAEVWEYSTSFGRRDKVVVALTESAGMSKEEVDDLFRNAAKM